MLTIHVILLFIEYMGNIAVVIEKIIKISLREALQLISETKYKDQLKEIERNIDRIN